MVLPLRLSKETSAKVDNGGGVSWNRWAGKGEFMVGVEISSKAPSEEARVQCKTAPLSLEQWKTQPANMANVLATFCYELARADVCTRRVGLDVTYPTPSVGSCNPSSPSSGDQLASLRRESHHRREKKRCSQNREHAKAISAAPFDSPTREHAPCPVTRLSRSASQETPSQPTRRLIDRR